MKKDRNSSCVIFGGGSLPIRCAEIWLSKGLILRAVVSDDSTVQKWARSQGVECFAPEMTLVEKLQGVEFDYLLSIVNERILRDDVLRLPRLAAINYHDAPLPRYAGTHATSWAILNGEQTHGVTWHLISETVDAGDVLKQKLFEIDPDETALTLNTKCFEAGAQAFDELAGELAANSLTPIKQDLAQRSFFPRFKRPRGGGVIDWNDTAENISRLIRALDFGAHPNALGTAKICVNDDFFIVREVEIAIQNSGATPGTITALGADFMRVAAAGGELVMRRFFELNGEPVAISRLKQDYNLRENSRLPILPPETLRKIESINGEACRREAFWIKKLKSATPAPAPFIEQRVEIDGAPQNATKINLPEEFSVYVKEQNSGNESELLLTVFGALLARLNGQDSFEVGFSNAKMRNHVSGIEKLFAAVLPLSFEVDCRQTIKELELEVQARVKELEEYTTYSFDLPARFPVLENVSPLPVCFEITERLPDAAPSIAADLKLIAAENESDLLLIYDRQRFSEAAIDRLKNSFEALLKAFAAAPDTPIAHLPLVSSEEKRKIVERWNDNRLVYDEKICIHQLFERSARRSPEATAIYWNETRVSYGELNEKANRIANYLLSLGVEPETIVGVALERSPDLIAAILGVLKAGGAYLPLDQHYPQERLALMLEDSGAPFLLTTQATLAQLGEHNASVICLDRDEAIIAAQSKKNPASDVAQNNLAYLIYTSGSTGKPKGVAIEHRSAAAFIAWALTVFSSDDLRGTAASTSVCFDLSVFEIFAPFAAGASIVLLENILHLKDAPARRRVTLINTVPSAIAELLRFEGVPGSVKIVNLAGEPLKPALVKKIYALDTIEKVYDLYGPTEDTTYSTYTLRDTGAATIGRAIANSQAYILDRFLEVVPVGIAGELYLSGDGLARGYLNRPELTAEKFIENPFTGSGGAARMYKTGDLARFNENGEIEYLGRIDNQVKIRGFRVELGEIEALLASLSGVKDAAVVAREEKNGEKRLVAYLAFQENQRVEANQLRGFLKQKLPDFMVPSAIVELDELPLTPNGKIDRKALPAPTAEDFADTKRQIVAHRDQLEEKLIGIWENILELRPIGIDDDFFALGGHSLQAVRMFAEIEKTFRVKIPLATLFQAGTIEKLAEILRRDDWEAPESSLVPIQPEGEKPIFFCVHAKGGNVLFYRALAQRLGEDQPFYGIQARRLGGRQVGHDNLKEMAEFYIREIKTVQPEGPYYLGGSSFGGLAAFEMARQLRAAGERVALLALLDTGTPDYPKFLPETSFVKRKMFNFIRRFELHRDNLKALTARQKFNYAGEKIKKIRLKYRRLIRDRYKKAVRIFYARTKGAGGIPKSYIQLEDQIWRAGQNYQPEIYAGDVTLFRATLQPLGIEPDETLGWREFVGGTLEIFDVPGHHGSIVVEPYVSVLAEKLKFCLESAQTSASDFSENRRAAKSKAQRAVGV